MRLPTFLSLAVGVAAITMQTTPPSPSGAMTSVAERYVQAVLALGQHDADYVDAFYGPAAWKDAAAQATGGLDTIAARAAGLRKDLSAIPAGEAELDRLRHQYLDRQLASLEARVRMLRGERLSFDEESKALYDAVDHALPGWVVGHVDRLTRAYRGTTDPEAHAAAVAAGERARVEIGARLAALLAEDVDAQRTNPLAILRSAVSYPTEVLRAAGVPEVVRDEFAERAFPADAYDLSPATWRDLGDVVHEAGLVWGAAKAHVHLARRRAQGQR